MPGMQSAAVNLFGMGGWPSHSDGNQSVPADTFTLSLREHCEKQQLTYSPKITGPPSQLGRPTPVRFCHCPQLRIIITVHHEVGLIASSATVVESYPFNHIEA